MRFPLESFQLNILYSTLTVVQPMVTVTKARGNET